MSESIVIENQGRVRVFKLNRPKAKNAFNNEMYLSFAKAITEADSNPEVRVLLITGEGDAFSAGQDLGELIKMKHTDEIGFEHVIDALMACQKPVLTAVNGLAVGIGTTMLPHTDINYASNTARFKCPFVPLGVVPEAGSSYLLPQTIGLQRTNEFLFTARWLSAEEALEYGLIYAVTTPEALLETALKTAQAIAEQPPGAVRASKALLRRIQRDAISAARNMENEEFSSRMGSPENEEAIKAFFEKRPPDFSKFS